LGQFVWLVSEGKFVFYLKVREKSENFTFYLPLGLTRIFCCWQGNVTVVSKNNLESTVFVALPTNDLSCMVSENWFVVSEQSKKSERISFVLMATLN